LKFDQLAYYAHNEVQVAQLKQYLGLEDAEWIEDEVRGDVYLPEEPGKTLGDWGLHGWSRGHLRFCYAYGIELEILTYLSGPHWHQGDLAFRQGMPFLSHVGIHCDEGEEPWCPTERLVQQMTTRVHTNPYLVERGRTYNYLIYDTRPLLGHYTKFIYRKEG